MKQLFFIFIIIVVQTVSAYSQQSDSILFKDCYELYDQKLKNEAYDCFEQFDTNMKAVYNLALIALETGDSLNFIKHSNKLISNQFYSPKSVAWYLDLYEQDSLICLSLLETALKKFQNDTLLLQYKIHCLYRNNEYKELIETIDKFFASKQQVDTANLCYQAQAFDNLGNSDEALSTYKRALQIDSLCYIANYNAGVIYYNKAVENTEIAYYIRSQEDYERDKIKADSLFNLSLPYFLRASKVSTYDKSLLNTIKSLYDRLGIENQLTYQYEIEIEKDYWKIDPRIPNEYFDEKYRNDGKVHLHFQSAFKNDSVLIKVNEEFYGKYYLTTNWSTELAKIVRIPNKENIQTISISINNGEEAKFEINQMNIIAIIYNKYYLKIRYLKHVPSYD